jgi:8-oxo-dGTP pyrophosphatase MutT (NUDIX family)
MKNVETPFTTLWESPARNHIGQPFMTVKSWEGRYYFSERAGVDSVAFILHDEQANTYGLVKEFKCPVNKFMISAFGGSIDSFTATPVDIVINETREEAGFEVFGEDIQSLGKVLVSTQSNQFCYLFVVKVNRSKQLELKPENDLEALASVVWMNKRDIVNLEDWKAITIIHKTGV